MSQINIKQGETFILNGQYTEDNGTSPKSLVGIVLSSQIRDKYDNLIDTLTVTINNAALGTYTIIGNTSTLEWHPGILYWDLMQKENGSTTISATCEVLVERGITRG